ncbi:hypothetical protein SDC9_195284 [bioreactor metagenome]|uniref:Uncharacterized protein n=1 Tax=bioreactor metagenome TaxID=1076179 RepID=A0A645I9A1_9ZZZZ
MFPGGIVPAQLDQHHRQVHVRLRVVGPQPQRHFILLGRFRQTPPFRQDIPIVVPRLWFPGIQFHGTAKGLFGLLQPPGHGIRVTQIAVGPCIIRLGLERAFEMGDGCLQISFHSQRDSVVIVGIGMHRVLFQDKLVMRDRLVYSPHFRQCIAKIIMCFHLILLCRHCPT